MTIALELLLCGGILLLFCLSGRLQEQFLAYQLSILIVFLAVLSIVGTLDETLPIYFLAAVAPVVAGISLSVSLSSVIYLIYGLYFLVGLLLQDISGTMTTFLTRLFQFIIFFFVLENKKITKYVEAKSASSCVIYATLAECVLGIYMLANSTQYDSGSGLTRLVSNSQPITGNITIVILPVLIYEYFSNEAQRREKNMLFICSVVLFSWILRSGTRGYLIVFLLAAFPIFCVQAGIRYNHGMVRISARTMIIFAIVSVLFFAILIHPTLYNSLASYIGLNRTVGIRTYENALIKEYLASASICEILFGIGIGGSGAAYPAFQNALNHQNMLGMWNFDIYYSSTGTVFHNLFANIILTQGIVGISLLAAITIRIVYVIWTEFSYNKVLRTGLLGYYIGFLFMNCFRWSASCGIAEMIVLSFILRLNKTNTDEPKRL